MDEMSAWVAQLRKGVVELLVLGLVRRIGDLHGYAIVRELRGLGLDIGESTVYPVLKRLESDGQLDAVWSHEAPGPPRKYYRMTEDGAAFLRQATAEWETLVGAVERLKGDA